MASGLNATTLANNIFNQLNTSMVPGQTIPTDSGLHKMCVAIALSIVDALQNDMVVKVDFTNPNPSPPPTIPPGVLVPPSPTPIKVIGDIRATVF